MDETAGLDQGRVGQRGIGNQHPGPEREDPRSADPVGFMHNDRTHIETGFTDAQPIADCDPQLGDQFGRDGRTP